MFSRKILPWLAVGLVLALVLAGCGAQGEDASESAPPEEESIAAAPPPPPPPPPSSSEESGSEEPSSTAPSSQAPQPSQAPASSSSKAAVSSSSSQASSSSSKAASSESQGFDIDSVISEGNKYAKAEGLTQKSGLTQKDAYVDEFVSDDYNTKAEVVAYLKRLIDAAVADGCTQYRLYAEPDGRGNYYIYLLTMD